ncbi:hemoglobin subunit mu-like [Ornithorhynchus anatinus]|uniref:Hemoglobin subunit mu n=1 Tax=Ornithorhynchus anatinus TaxID=9258 RepID=A0A6I8MZR1_ORNAN|nr:hemoglobin subunit mu-like [Ornithorhynchus anatinus]
MLSPEEQGYIFNVWDLIAGHEAAFGAELLHRLLIVYPTTRAYFPHLSVQDDPSQLLHHGWRVLVAVGEAVKNLDNLTGALAPLSELHTGRLRVDPTNYPLLIQCFQVVLASHLQGEYTPELQAAWEKFLTAVATILAGEYR